MQKAFTLVELLVVVLIIGVLSAIAIPMYQGAVDKSHWSTMLPGAKAIKDAEEAIKMTNGAYTDNMANLDVTMNNSDLTFTLVTPNNTADPNVVRVTNSRLANVRLASYLDDNPKFAGQLHCEAKTGDERANKLCGKLLMGQELTEQDGYVGYLLDQEIDKATCDNASRSWSTSKTKCYKDDPTRCNALDSNYLGDGQCGFQDQNSKTIGEEEICQADTNGCHNTIVEDGGECIAGPGDYKTNNCACCHSTIKNGGVCRVTAGSYTPCADLIIEEGGMCVGSKTIGYGRSCSHNSNGIKGAVICNHGGPCGEGSVYDGGICVGNKGQNCITSTFKNGAICYANVNGACKRYGDYIPENVYEDTSCCCGTYCPDSAPKCASSRCDPYYMDPNNFKDL